MHTYVCDSLHTITQFSAENSASTVTKFSRNFLDLIKKEKIFYYANRKHLSRITCELLGYSDHLLCYYFSQILSLGSALTPWVCLQILCYPLSFTRPCRVIPDLCKSAKRFSCPMTPLKEGLFTEPVHSSSELSTFYPLINVYILFTQMELCGRFKEKLWKLQKHKN